MSSTTAERSLHDGREDIELHIIEDRVSESINQEQATALHPTDRGFHAWLFLASASGLELLVWGFPLWLAA